MWAVTSLIRLPMVLAQVLNNTTAARDEVETKLELTGKEISVKMVIADDAFIIGFMDLNEYKKYKPFTAPTKVSFDPSKPPLHN